MINLVQDMHCLKFCVKLTFQKLLDVFFMKLSRKFRLMTAFVRSASFVTNQVVDANS